MGDGGWVGWGWGGGDDTPLRCPSNGLMRCLTRCIMGADKRSGPMHQKARERDHARRIKCTLIIQHTLFSPRLTSPHPTLPCLALPCRVFVLFLSCRIVSCRRACLVFSCHVVACLVFDCCRYFKPTEPPALPCIVIYCSWLRLPPCLDLTSLALT